MKIEHNDGFHVSKGQHGSTAEYKDADHIDHKKLYTELFKIKRREQLIAVESIVHTDTTKQTQLVKEVVRNIRKILEESRNTLERTGQTADAPFPQDEGLKEKLSKVLENIAFFSDLSIRFPLLENEVRKDVGLRSVIIWAYNYSIQTGLLDVDTSHTVEIMAQQHEFIPKREGYFNPFGKIRTREDIEREALEEQRKRKEKKERELKLSKKQKKNGPKISKTEL